MTYPQDIFGRLDWLTKKIKQLCCSLADSGVGNYKVYVANLSQASTNAPTDDLVVNTLGDYSYSYEGVGLYELTFTESFAGKNVLVFFNLGNGVNDPLNTANVSYTIELDKILIHTYYEGVLSNDVLSDGDLFYKSSIEIRVYN